MSYLIRNNELIAETTLNLKSGSTVSYSFHSTKERINADIDVNLVNAKNAKISNAKKWDNEYIEFSAVAINNNDDEFLVS